MAGHHDEGRDILARISDEEEYLQKEEGIGVTEGSCASPPHLVSQSLLHVPNYGLVCTGRAI